MSNNKIDTTKCYLKCHVEANSVSIVFCLVKKKLIEKKTQTQSRITLYNVWGTARFSLPSHYRLSSFFRVIRETHLKCCLPY